MSKDFDSATPPHNHYFADSGSQWHHFSQDWTRQILSMFDLHFSIVEVEIASSIFFTFRWCQHFMAQRRSNHMWFFIDPFLHSCYLSLNDHSQTEQTGFALWRRKHLHVHSHKIDQTSSYPSTDLNVVYECSVLIQHALLQHYLLTVYTVTVYMNARVSAKQLLIDVWSSYFQHNV